MRSVRFSVAIAAISGFVLGAIAMLLMVASGWLPGSGRHAGAWGKFPAYPKVEFLSDGRELRLLDDFVYVDPREKVWVAKKDSIVNGASIPQTFWSLTGGPLEGKYRNASIVHDEACVEMTEPWEDVHLMFYEACRCGGMPDETAKVLYAAVYYWGPRWNLRQVMETTVQIGPDGEERPRVIARNVSELSKPTERPPPDKLEKLRRLVKERDLSLEDLRKLDPRSL